MNVKDHYDKHLGNFYSWLAGDFQTQSDAFKSFCVGNGIQPLTSRHAIDLGAGNGIQSIALADLGFSVKAIDFNNQLLAELASRIGNHPIEIINDDIRHICEYSAFQPELITCCCDTLPHLQSSAEIQQFLRDIHATLLPNGKLILTFRDYSTPLEDTQRFIPVKSDPKRVFTCFLEYLPEKVRVTDLLYEYENEKWVQKISSYEKTRITSGGVVEFLNKAGFKTLQNTTQNRLVHIIAQKVAP